MSFTETVESGTSNSTSDVTLVSAPGSGERHVIKTVSIVNIDTASATVTVMFDDSVNQRTVLSVTLAVGDNLIIDDPLVLGSTTDTLKMKLAGAISTSQLDFTSHYGVVT